MSGLGSMIENSSTFLQAESPKNDLNVALREWCYHLILSPYIKRSHNVYSAIFTKLLRTPMTNVLDYIIGFVTTNVFYTLLVCKEIVTLTHFVLIVA